uniref:Uncharacterized protein n=1 Tax=Anguilla anguilla TaxID=7936 RepID=A0A0E9TSM9_ANGAN
MRICKKIAAGGISTVQEVFVGKRLRLNVKISQVQLSYPSRKSVWSKEQLYTHKNSTTSTI